MPFFRDKAELPDRKAIFDRVVSSPLERHSEFLATLGRPLYLSKPFQYRDGLASRNRDMLQAFPTLYEFLLKRLAVALGATVHFDPFLAVPGFHVIDSPTPFPGGTWHSDVFPAYPIASEYSFTLLLGDDSGPFTIDLREGRRQVSHDHKPGILSIMDSHTEHRISPMTAGRRRVTLQGHATPSARGFALFW